MTCVTLLSTADFKLGASINATAMKTHTWTGENKQGKHTMGIRDYFRENFHKYGPGNIPDKVEDEVLWDLYNRK